MATGRNLPPPQSPFVNQDFTLSFDGYQFLLNLLSASNDTTSTVGDGLTATGATQATALLLTNDWNEITTVAANTGVLLAGLQAGEFQKIFNAGANPLKVYPPPGSRINALAVNTAFSLAAGSSATFDFISSSQIRT